VIIFKPEKSIFLNNIFTMFLKIIVCQTSFLLIYNSLVNKRVFYFSSNYYYTFVITVENEIEKHFQQLEINEKKKLEEEKLKQEIENEKKKR